MRCPREKPSPEAVAATRSSPPTFGSNDEAYWLCDKGATHWYSQRIDRKVAGYGCSLCSRRRLVPWVNDLATTDPLLVTEWPDYLNVAKRPEFMFAGTDRYWWKCAFGHVRQQSVPNRRKSRGCTECEPEDRILNENRTARERRRSASASPSFSLF
ncbi:zinc-ribbon domain-containing protein [Curtobacterium flaccumfaciens]|uniref:zinc-ribbon domain-containing protein n=1 Tax=Curtobacterium flaccumfaciens TaxID=2035 RepID=UPI003F81A28F